MKKKVLMLVMVTYLLSLSLLLSDDKLNFVNNEITNDPSLRSQNFPWYSQRDPLWSNDLMGNSDCTLGLFGCATTCMAMLHQAEVSGSSNTVTPGTLNAWLGSNGGYQNGNIIWSVACNQDGSEGLKYVNNFSDIDNNWSWLDNELNQGRKVVVRVDYNSNTPSFDQHWVLVYEKNGPSGISSSYKINDPWPTTYQDKTLADYVNVNNIAFNAGRSFSGTWNNTVPEVTCIWTVSSAGSNPDPLPSNYIFWNNLRPEDQYVVYGEISGLENGAQYNIALYNPDGSVLVPDVYMYPGSNNFSFMFGGLSNHPGSGYRFKAYPQGYPNSPYNGTQSNPWKTYPVPDLHVSVNTNPVYQGQPIYLSWYVDGGAPGLPNGGLPESNFLRFQWYQNGSAAPYVLTSDVPVSQGSFSFIVDAPPGENYKIGVSNATADMLPNGYPSAMSDYFTIYPPVSSDNNVIEKRSGIIGNYPNPFNPKTEILFSITSDQNVSFKIYNAKGEIVDIINSKFYNKGDQRISWENSNLPTGVYYIKMMSNEGIYFKKIMLLK